jgi:hypothetical protein
MKKVFLIIAFALVLSVSSFAQKASPTEQDKTAVIPSDSYLKRGAAIGAAEKVSLNAVL